MTKAPEFFVPAATTDNQESVYVGFAQWSHSVVPKLGERIYSITYVHYSDVWTATVGEPLRGIRRRTARSHGKKVERTTQLSDPAIVLAIFAGDPYFVVTNHRIAGDVGSGWENPFMVGRPTNVTYFSAPH